MTGREDRGRHQRRDPVVGLEFDTTGVLGVSRPRRARRARLSRLAHLPRVHDLATGRRWHFVFAWLFVVNGLALSGLQLVQRPSVARPDAEPRAAARASASIIDHAPLRFAHGEDARSYNVLQKFAYLGVIAVLAVMVLTGLTMSPGVNAAAPWLVDLFGGRQSARTIHFLCATATVLFVLVHVVHGDPHRHLEQRALDDHRQLRHQADRSRP